MKKLSLNLFSMIAFLAFSGMASAATTIPGHGDFADDDGTELWYPENQVSSFKAFENPAVTGLASFGFYFSTDPNTLITIFGPEDQALTSEAVIDFTAGTVWDVDDAVTQSTFTNLGTSIGFWFELDDPSPLRIFTQKSLTNGFDYAYSLPSLSDSSKYAITFFITEGGDTPIAVDVFAGITPVPLPAALPIMMTGLAGLGLIGLTRHKKAT